MSEKASDTSAHPSQTTGEMEQQRQQEQSDVQQASNDVETQKEPDVVFPPAAVVVPILITIYMGLFLVALVIQVHSLVH